MGKLSLLLIPLLFCPGIVFALEVVVDPVSGVDDGTSPFKTIPAALTALAGADSADDVVNLLDNGLHALTAQLTIGTTTADGNLTMRSSPANSTAPIVRLPGVGAPQISIRSQGSTTVSLEGIVLIGAAGSGAVGGDGIQVTRSNTTGVATCNITDCTFAANNGSDVPLDFTASLTTAGASYPGDDWIDYFPDTQGTLVNVAISHAADEGVIIRGTTSGLGAVVTMTGRSLVSHCGGRAFQSAFGGSDDATVPTVNLLGTLTERIRVFGNVETSPEPTVTWFNGRITMEYVDVVNNEDIGIMVGTDAVDDFSMNFCRVAGNGNGSLVHEGILFLYATGDLQSATVTNCTFHDQKGPGDAVRVAAAVTTAVLNFTDTIFTGNGQALPSDQINIETGSTATVNFSNCALVQEDPFSMAVPLFVNQSPTAEVGTISLSPYYQDVAFDPTDPANTEYLGVVGRNDEYLTASSTGGELVGGNGNPVIQSPPPSSVGGPWELYR